MGFEGSTVVQAVDHVPPTARLRFYTRPVRVTFVVVSPQGRTNKGKLLIENRGSGLLFCHRLFGPLSSAPLTLEWNS